MLDAEQIAEAATASEDIAASLRRIAEAAEALNSAGLTRNALLVLLHDKTRVGKRDISRVLDALGLLDTYTTKERDNG